ncbi:MAG: pyridoxal phosphate-dependent aminotransferase [Geminicoccaceae bacterium]
MGPIREEIAALELSGITRVAMGAWGDPEVIPLWFGESDLVTAPFIREAAKTALDEGHTFYANSRGTHPLREELKRYHDRLYGMDLHPDRMHVVGATMLTVVTALQCLAGRGDEVILIGPYWPNVRNVCTMVGATHVEVRLAEDGDRWHLDLGDVARAIGPRTKAVYVNSPSNPTGWVMSRQGQQDLLDLCRRHGLGLIADEVYHRNVLSGTDPAPSFLQLAGPDEPVFVLNGFSKAWAMTGWRLGWMVAPQYLVEPMQVMAECNNTGATVFAQYGGLAALQEGEPFVAAFNARCRRNAEVVMATLGAHPRVRLLRPEGAFYAFPEIDGVDDSLAFAKRVLAEAKVGIAAGYTFGAGNGSHVRLCFAIATDRLEQAMHRIIRVLDRL